MIILILYIILATFNYSIEYINKDINTESKKLFINIYNEKNIKKVEEENNFYVYKLKNKESSEIIEILKSISNIKMSGIDNSIILYGADKEIHKIEEIIKKIDIKKKQVLVKMYIIDTNKNLFERLGFNWKLKDNLNLTQLASNLIQKNMSFGEILSIGGNFLDVDIDALKEKGDIVIKTIPSIVVLDGEKGLFKITNENFMYTSKNKKNNESVEKEAGIIINVTPKIKYTDNNDEYVLLNIKSELSSFKTKYSKSKNIIETVVSLKNNSSMFLGGLSSYNNSKSKSSTPIVSNIPIIGAFFTYNNKSKGKREVFIEIEVKII